MSNARSARIADQIQRSLAELIRLEVRDPRVGLVTLTGVELSRDQSHAKVFFTVMGAEHDAEAASRGLANAAGFLRNSLFKRLKIHTVPTLHFQFDRTTERAADLNALINKANASHAADDD